MSGFDPNWMNTARRAMQQSAQQREEEMRRGFSRYTQQTRINPRDIEISESPIHDAYQIRWRDPHSGMGVEMSMTRAEIRDVYSRTPAREAERDFVMRVASERIVEEYLTPRYSRLDLESAKQAADKVRKHVEERFHTLFGVPSGAVTIKESTVNDLGEVRIRVHVAAFTVETTMGALAAAKNNPAAAFEWYAQYTGNMEAANRRFTTAARSAAESCATRVLDDSNVIERVEEPKA